VSKAPKTEDYLRYLREHMASRAFDEGPIREILLKMAVPPEMVDEPVEPKTLKREPIEKKDGPDKTELYGWHCSEEGPRVPRGGLILRLPIFRGRAPLFVSWDGETPSQIFPARSFRRVSSYSRTFIEEGVPTYDGETGKIVECPCASCANGWTKPGQALKSYGLSIEKAS
jgi:hypothetical protein